MCHAIMIPNHVTQTLSLLALESTSMARCDQSDWLNGSGVTRALTDARAIQDVQARLEALLRISASFEDDMDRQRDTDGSHRRKTGVYYTPPRLVQRVLDLSLRPILQQIQCECGDDQAHLRERVLGLRVCDPACGSGNLLLAATVMMAKFVPSVPVAALVESCVFGIEIDDESVVVASHLLSALSDSSGGVRTNIHRGDALLDELPFPAAFDLVIGNPPFVDSERLCKDKPGYRDEVAGRYESARGNWDLSCVFIERAIELSRAGGGCVALVVPDRVFASDYAASVQSILRRNRLRDLVHVGAIEHETFNGAELPVSLLVVDRVGPGRSPATIRVRRRDESVHTFPSEMLDALPPGHWTALFRLGEDAALDPLVERLVRASRDHRMTRLADIAHVGDGCTTKEAYELCEHIEDRSDADPRRFFRMVNTGTIDPFCVRWGERTMRYLRGRYTHPVVSRDRLRTIMPRRFEQASAPKVLLAGLCQRLEAVGDQHGSLLCGKSAMQVIPFDGSVASVHALTAWLNSELVNRLYACVFGGRGFGRGTMNVGARQLRWLPVPSAQQRQRLIDAKGAASDVDVVATEIAHLMVDGAASAVPS